MEMNSLKITWISNSCLINQTKRFGVLLKICHFHLCNFKISFYQFSKGCCRQIHIEYDILTFSLNVCAQLETEGFTYELMGSTPAPVYISSRSTRRTHPSLLTRPVLQPSLNFSNPDQSSSIYVYTEKNFKMNLKKNLFCIEK